MPITLYNTLTKSFEKFHPIQQGRVSMYMCGPTVYNFFHIGNARTFVIGDVIRRYFQFRGFDVRFVMNITDVDDKIIQKAREDGVDSKQVAEEFTQAFLIDLDRLGVRKADAYPRATSCMDEIIRYIEKLEDTGAAYAVDGDVFFRISAFPSYGKLSGKKIEDLIAGARVESDPRKEQPADFALWKRAKEGEPSWQSRWGPGRPGWHIECSVMSQMELGDTFDIHAGGNDLIFPHHENEIAQSEALTKAPLAHYWLHFGFLNIDNEKMSKSLGNFFTAREVLEKYDAETVRFFFLQTHYRSPLNFSSEGLDAAKKGLQKLGGILEELRRHSGSGAFDVARFRTRFADAVDDDFNTPAGMGVLFDFIREVNAALRSDDGLSKQSIGDIERFLHDVAGDVFGIIPKADGAQATDDDLPKLMHVLIETRQKAREEKQWAIADFIRDRLKESGFLLEDGKAGTIWKRIHE